MRTFGIWFFGLVAAAIIGGLAGNFIAPYSSGGFLGMLAGLCTFACGRLWVARR